MIALSLSILGMALLSFSGKRPSNVGINIGHLAPIPESPNAVASFGGDALQKMEPIELDGVSGIEMMQRIKSVIEAMPRSNIIVSDDKYLYAEFQSLIFRFTDDVEFLVDEDNKRVDYRSVSRVGYSDMGVNRKRMETILQELKTD